MSQPKILISSQSEKQGSAKQVLILTSKTGGGHESIAQAVKEALEKKFQVKIYDDMPVLGSRVYFYVHHYLPTLYNLGHRLTDRPFFAKILHLASFLTTLSSLRKIPYEDYDLVFSCQPFLTYEVVWLMKKPKLVVLFNDPIYFHHVWLCHSADFSLATTKQAKQLVVKRGMPAKKVTVCGFPVRRQFLEKLPNKKALRKKIGLKPNQFTVFIGGSGYGVRETQEIIKNLEKHSGSGRMNSPGVNLQLIVVCGRNRSLQKSLPQKKNIKIFGFVQNMAELMKASDLIVSKAGPNLLFESIILGIPFLATGYPPEQEKGNWQLIKKYKIGFIEENSKKAAELIKKLAKNPQKLKAIIPNIRKLARIHQPAPKIIASQITHLLKNSMAAKRR